MINNFFLEEKHNCLFGFLALTEIYSKKCKRYDIVVTEKINHHYIELLYGKSYRVGEGMIFSTDNPFLKILLEGDYHSSCSYYSETNSNLEKHKCYIYHYGHSAFLGRADIYGKLYRIIVAMIDSKPVYKYQKIKGQVHFYNIPLDIKICPNCIDGI